MYYSWPNHFKDGSRAIRGFLVYSDYVLDIWSTWTDEIVQHPS